MKNQTHYTRREFIKAAGTAIPAAALPGIAFAAEATKSSKTAAAAKKL